MSDMFSDNRSEKIRAFKKEHEKNNIIKDGNAYSITIPDDISNNDLKKMLEKVTKDVKNISDIQPIIDECEDYLDYISSDNYHDDNDYMTYLIGLIKQ